MAYLFLRASLDWTSPYLPGSSQSYTVRTTDTLRPYSCRVCPETLFLEPPSGTTLPRSERTFAHRSTSCTADSRARTSALQALERAWKESAAAWFSRRSDLLKNSRRRLSSWKTCQPLGPVELNEWGKNWPASGMIVDGYVYPLETLEPHTSADAGSCLLPTPTACTYGRNKGQEVGAKVRPSLETMARKNLWSTPRATDGTKGSPNQAGSKGDLTLPSAVAQWSTPTTQDAKNNGAPSQRVPNTLPLNAQVGGSLNPTWVEWLMGYPSEWTALEDWATQWFRPKREKRSESL